MNTITLETDAKQIPMGRIIYEAEAKVWERSVTEQRHCFRWGRAWDGTEVKDAWTVGENLLAQLRQAGVEVIRYVCRDETYEIEISEFLKRARELDQAEWSFQTELQWALPRSEWRHRSLNGQLGLFPEVAA